MKIANLNSISKKFRETNTMASTCNCGVCNCNCGSGTACSHFIVSKKVSDILNSQITKILTSKKKQAVLA